MIAHLSNGTARTIRPGGNTMGLHVVRWELDFADIKWLIQNPEALGILHTRMPPPEERAGPSWGDAA
jgi:hypothetical protein